MKSFAKLAVAGISGVVLFKLFATILFPILGLMLGLLALTVKLALIAAVVFFVYSMIRKRKPEAEAEVDENEIEVE
jgi:hypothetical protein